MQKVSFGRRLQYGFDSVMARGTPALIGLLAAITLALVGIVAIFLYFSGAATNDDGTPMTVMDILREGTNHAFNTGDVWNGSGTLLFIVAMVVVSLGGMFILSALIGILTTALDGRLLELRKGRSVVLEKGHTIVLGWSPQVFSVLHELAIANSNTRRPRVAILASKDKVEMEDEVDDKVPDLGNLKVVCRTGNPIDLVDLNIVNPQDSRSIIVLAPEHEDPDSEVIKSVLAITRNPNRRAEPYHIVAQIRDARNMDAARLVGGGETQFIDVGDAVARLIAQTCRQVGLSTVYTDLLSFEGDEIYTKEEPALVGKSFGDALPAFEKSTVLGLLQGETVRLNPPMDTRIDAGDQLIAIAEDDNTISYSGERGMDLDTGALRDIVTVEPVPERTLILGWNWRATKIICELDHYVAPGSLLTILCNVPAAQEEVNAHCEQVRNQRLEVHIGDATSRPRLEWLNVGTYDHVIVLAYSDTLDPQRADARTLITLLHLRDIREKSGKEFSIVSEMQDIRNKDLAQVARADDLIVSDRLISLMTAQICENRHLKDVFADIFNAGGNEIYIKPASEYVRPGTTVDFYAIVEAARRCGQVAMGYRLHADSDDPDKNYGVVLNPHKKQPVTLGLQDKVIVLAES
ncbi:MAG TPA: potassium transporter TrkA [Chloroflexia bacterium]|nr:potassium transporter TrkA [Chloroflexia bacterium]